MQAPLRETSLRQLPVSAGQMTLSQTVDTLEPVWGTPRVHVNGHSEYIQSNFAFVMHTSAAMGIANGLNDICALGSDELPESSGDPDFQVLFPGLGPQLQ